MGPPRRPLTIRKLRNRKSLPSGRFCQNQACSATRTAKRGLHALSLPPQNSAPTSGPRRRPSRQGFCHRGTATCRRKGACAGGLGKRGVFQLCSPGGEDATWGLWPVWRVPQVECDPQHHRRHRRRCYHRHPSRSAAGVGDPGSSPGSLRVLQQTSSRLGPRLFSCPLGM